MDSLDILGQTDTKPRRKKQPITPPIAVISDPPAYTTYVSGDATTKDPNSVSGDATTIKDPNSVSFDPSSTLNSRKASIGFGNTRWDI